MGYESNLETIARRKGALYSFSTDHVIKRELDKIDISNGLVWSLDNRLLYYIDSLTRQVWAFDYDLSTGSIC